VKLTLAGAARARGSGTASAARPLRLNRATGTWWHTGRHWWAHWQALVGTLAGTGGHTGQALAAHRDYWHAGSASDSQKLETSS